MTQDFLPERFFEGHTQAHGILQDRSGRLRRRFVAVMHGHMEDGDLVLDERFRFDDGEATSRTWRLKPLGDGRYEGRADDVVGHAKGRLSADRFRLDYRMRVAIGDRTWNVRFRDEMFPVGARHIVNRASLHLFGMRIADLTVAMEKPSRGDGFEGGESSIL